MERIAEPDTHYVVALPLRRRTASLGSIPERAPIDSGTASRSGQANDSARPDAGSSRRLFLPPSDSTLVAIREWNRIEGRTIRAERSGFATHFGG